MSIVVCDLINNIYRDEPEGKHSRWCYKTRLELWVTRPLTSSLLHQNEQLQTSLIYKYFIYEYITFFTKCNFKQLFKSFTN